MASMCLRLATLVVFVAMASAHCPPHWTAYKDSCFRIFAKPLPWREAETLCMSYSTCEGNEVGHLASVSDVAANSFIVQYKKILEKPGGAAARLWLGFNDLVMERQFEWSSGANVSFTNWEQGQPNNDQGQEHCAVIPGLNSLDQWDDINCVETHPFICELPGVDKRHRNAPAQFRCPV